MDTEQKSIRAKQLLDDAVLKEVFSEIEAAALMAWKSTTTDNVQQREYSWLTVKVLDRLRDALQVVADAHHFEASIAVRAPR